MADETISPGATAAVDAAQAATHATATGTAVVARPDWLPEPYWDATKNAANSEALTKDLSELTTLRGERDARAKDIPQDGAYKWELDEGFKTPDGITYQPPAADDPEVKAFGEIAKALGLTQSQYRALLTFEAQRRLSSFQGEQKRLSDLEVARNADMKSLGENVGPRIEQLTRTINALHSGGAIKDAQRDLLSALLGSAYGVQLAESEVERLNKGVPMRGLPGNPGMKKSIDVTGMSAMQIFNAAAAGR